MLYQETMENFFNSKENDLFKEFNSEKESILWHRKLYLNSEIFTFKFRSSLYIQIIGFIEYELKRICNFYKESNLINVSINDFKGNSEFEKAKKYLSKICGLDFNDLNPEWSYLLNAKEIRNILIHNQGEFVQNEDRKSKKVERFVRGKKYFEFQPSETYGDFDSEIYSLDGNITITSKYANEELIENSRSLFYKIFSSL